MRFSKTFVWLPVTFCLMVACRPRETSSLSHENDAYMTNAEEAHWIILSHEEFRSLGTFFLQEKNTGNQVPFDTIPSDSPLVQRLQFWVNELDAVVRKHNTGGSGDYIPKPNVAVILKGVGADSGGSLNARIGYRGEVKINGEAIPPAKVGDEVFLSVEHGKTIRPNKIGHQLGREMGVMRDLEALGAAWITHRSKKSDKCRVTATDGKFDIKGTCQVFDQDAALANGLYTIAKPNWIHLGAGFLRSATEFDAVALMAHELAHYYKAHTLVPDSKAYNYFYKIGDRAKNGIPVPSQEMSKLAGQLNAFLIDNVLREIPHKGQSYPRGFYRLWENLLRKKAMKEALNTIACASLDEAYTKNDFHKSLDLMMTSDPLKAQLSKESVEDIKKFTSLVERCSESIEGEALERFTVTYGALLRDFFSSQKLSPMRDQAQVDNLRKLFELYRDLVIANVREHNKQMLHANKSGFAFWTHEQEADEIALNMLV